MIKLNVNRFADAFHFFIKIQRIRLSNSRSIFESVKREDDHDFRSEISEKGTGISSLQALIPNPSFPPAHSNQ